MIRFYTANMAGPYHIDHDIPCQDSFYVKRDKTGVIFASVADGLGSEIHSDDGSRIASKKSCDYCMEHYKRGMSFSEVKKIMNNAFVNAYKSVLEEANSAGNSSDEYDTTLCLAIYDNGHVFYGQSGDSGVIALMKSGEYVPLTTQQRDSDGYVFPLCSGPEMWTFGEVKDPVSSIMLMTDGVWEQICPPLLRNHDIKVNVALARKFMDRRETSLRAAKALGEAASKYLENYPRKQLDDDKTIVVIYNPFQSAKRLNKEYYKEPDWASLQEEAIAKLYEHEETIEQEHNNNNDESEDVSCEEGKNTDKECKPNSFITNQADQDHKECKLENVIHEKSSDSCHSTPKTNTSLQPKNKLISCWNNRNPKTEKSEKKTGIICGTRLFDFISLLILIGFSIVAFAMNGFVKEHAPETYLGVFLVCFIANSTVLLPAPSILVVLQFSMLLNPFAVALFGALGASLGELVGFMTGSHGGHLINNKYIKKLENIFPNHPFLFILIFSALPLPLFDIVGMMAGAIKLDKLKFYLTCFGGKLFKMLMFVWIGQYISYNI